MKEQYRLVSTLVNLLDNQFNFFGIKFGFAGLIGFIPGFGDIIDAVLSLYLILFAIRIKVPGYRIAQMLWNILINFLIALVPVIGDATYILRRVNARNLKILNQYIPAEYLDRQVTDKQR